MRLKIKLGTVKNAALFSSICADYDCDVDLMYQKYTIDGKSLMGVLSISPDHICEVEIHTSDETVKEKFKDDMSLWIVEE